MFSKCGIVLGAADSFVPDSRDPHA